MTLFPFLCKNGGGLQQLWWWLLEGMHLCWHFSYFLIHIHHEEWNSHLHFHLSLCRKLLTEYTSVTMDQMNLITFGMSAISLVGGVIQLAMISNTSAEDMYRSYLGKVAWWVKCMPIVPCLSNITLLNMRVMLMPEKCYLGTGSCHFSLVRTWKFSFFVHYLDLQPKTQ